MTAFHEQFIAALRDLADIKRRLDNTVRHGPVAEVDAKKQRVRLKTGGTEQEPQLSPWIPYGQVAGAVKLHTPPSVGQQMTMFAPTGDFRQAMAMPFTWSDDNKSPGEKPDEHVLTFENVSITMKKDSLKFAVGDASLEITKDTIASIAKEAIRATVGASEVEQKTGAVNVKAALIHAVGETHLGVDAKDEKAVRKVEVVADLPSKKTFAKL